MKKFLWRKLFIFSRSSKPYFILNFWSPRRSFLDPSKFVRARNSNLNGCDPFLTRDGDLNPGTVAGAHPSAAGPLPCFGTEPRTRAPPARFRRGRDAADRSAAPHSPPTRHRPPCHRVAPSAGLSPTSMCQVKKGTAHRRSPLFSPLPSPSRGRLEHHPHPLTFLSV
jgi:hypothetical protein